MSSIGSMQRMLLFLPVRYPTGPPHQLLSTWLGYSKNHRGARQAVRKCPVPGIYRCRTAERNPRLFAALRHNGG